MGNEGLTDVAQNLGALYERAEKRVEETRGFSAHIANLEVQLSDLLGPTPSNN